MSLTDLEIPADSGTNYKSFASVAEADVDLAVDPVRNAVWSTTSEENKKIYLVAATRRLNTQAWKGEKAGGNTQEDAFPRTGLKYPDGDDVPSDAVPREIERATALLAGTIAQTPAHADVEGGVKRAIRRVKAGAAEVEFATATVPGAAAASQGLGDTTVHALIAMWLTGSGGSRASIGGVASGTGEESKLTDDFRRNQGFA